MKSFIEFLTESKKLSLKKINTLKGQDFSFEELEGLKNYDDVLEYCSQRLELLGDGSSRNAYALNKRLVLKVARNQAGIAQNEQEQLDYARDKYGIFPQTIKSDDYGLWLVVERAHPLSEDKVKKLFGIDFDELINAMDFLSDSIKEKDKDMYDSFLLIRKKCTKGGKWFLGKFEKFLFDLGNAKEFLVSDLDELYQWGVVIRDDGEYPVIIDSGLTGKVWKKFYGSERIKTKNQIQPGMFSRSVKNI